MSGTTWLCELIDMCVFMTTFLPFIARNSVGDFASQAVLRARVSRRHKFAPSPSVVKSLDSDMLVDIAFAFRLYKMLQCHLRVGQGEWPFLHMRPNSARMRIGYKGRHGCWRAFVTAEAKVLNHAAHAL